MRLSPIALVLALPASAVAQMDPGACNPAADRGRVKGLVLDQYSGAPLQGASVTFAWPLPNGNLETGRAVTNRIGRYSFCEVPLNTRVSLRFSFIGRDAGTAVRLTEQTSSTDVDVVLDAPFSRVRGAVIEKESDKPVADAAITLGTQKLTVQTGADGAFFFERVPPGTYTVEIQHIAFPTLTDSLDVVLGETTAMTAKLSTFELAPIEVTTRSRNLEVAGFYERMAQGQGTYLTREEILASGPVMTSDVLRRLPGIRGAVGWDRPGMTLLGRTGCRIKYLLDGHPVGDVFQADDVEVTWIEAIEVYRGVSTLPTKFASALMMMEDVECGVVMIWTREHDQE